MTTFQASSLARGPKGVPAAGFAAEAEERSDETAVCTSTGEPISGRTTTSGGALGAEVVPEPIYTVRLAV